MSLARNDVDASDDEAVARAVRDALVRRGRQTMSWKELHDVGGPLSKGGELDVLARKLCLSHGHLLLRCELSMSPVVGEVEVTPDKRPGTKASVPSGSYVVWAYDSAEEPTDDLVMLASTYMLQSGHSLESSQYQLDGGSRLLRGLASHLGDDEFRARVDPGCRAHDILRDYLAERGLQTMSWDEMHEPGGPFSRGGELYDMARALRSGHVPLFRVATSCSSDLGFVWVRSPRQGGRPVVTATWRYDVSEEPSEKLLWLVRCGVKTTRHGIGEALSRRDGLGELTRSLLDHFDGSRERLEAAVSSASVTNEIDGCVRAVLARKNTDVVRIVSKSESYDPLPSVASRLYVGIDEAEALLSDDERLTSGITRFADGSSFLWHADSSFELPPSLVLTALSERDGRVRSALTRRVAVPDQSFSRAALDTVLDSVSAVLSSADRVMMRFASFDELCAVMPSDVVADALRVSVLPLGDEGRCASSLYERDTSESRLRGVALWPDLSVAAFDLGDSFEVDSSVDLLVNNLRSDPRLADLAGVMAEVCGLCDENGLRMDDLRASADVDALFPPSGVLPLDEALKGISSVYGTLGSSTRQIRVMLCARGDWDLGASAGTGFAWRLHDGDEPSDELLDAIVAEADASVATFDDLIGRGGPLGKLVSHLASGVGASGLETSARKSRRARVLASRLVDEMRARGTQVLTQRDVTTPDGTGTIVDESFNSFSLLNFVSQVRRPDFGVLMDKKARGVWHIVDGEPLTISFVRMFCSAAHRRGLTLDTLVDVDDSLGDMARIIMSRGPDVVSITNGLMP